MIQTSSSLLYLLILGIAALLPAVYLMHYIYVQDEIEKEPVSLLLKLVIGGIAAAGLSIVLENISGEVILYLTAVTRSYTVYAISTAVSVAFIEEGMKYCSLHLISWKDKAFDFRFDGIVYAVFVSLGFAAVENVLYVLNAGGIGVAVGRALLAIPAHAAFGILMGISYGRAKAYDSRGSLKKAASCKWKAVLSAAVLHMFYDGTLLIGTLVSALVFIGVVVLLYKLIFERVKIEARQDREISITGN